MIYFDNAATTAISESVLRKMFEVATVYGNPSSVHRAGIRASGLISEARQEIAKAINCSPSEIYFTSGGTESDNWALNTVVSNTAKKHIITTQIEHPAIYNTCKTLEKEGHTITYLQPDNSGIISVSDFEKAITEDTAMVSIMYANNEIGTIEPISEIGKICRNRNIIFHTDAVQAFGNVSIDVQAQSIDMMSVSGHKFNAPKGIGFLYVRKGIPLSPLIIGGGQERGMRSGTENTMSIVGLATAVKNATDSLLFKIPYVAGLRESLITQLFSTVDNLCINGGRGNRLCGNISLSVADCEAESLLLMLSSRGICVSAGSACSRGSLEPSRTLKAIGLSDRQSLSTIRISLCDNNTQDEIDEFVKVFASVVETLRRLRP